MHYPNIVRRLGAVPGLVRLLSLALEVISIVLLTLRHRSGEAYVTDYLILGYLVLVDAVEIASLFGQARGWPLPVLPIVIAGDSIGALMLVCSRDWHGYWYWHGPYYSLRQQIGMGLLITLPSLRLVLIFLEGLEFWYENREDRLLAAERQRLLPY